MSKFTAEEYAEHMQNLTKTLRQVFDVCKQFESKQPEQIRLLSDIKTLTSNVLNVADTNGLTGEAKTLVEQLRKEMRNLGDASQSLLQMIEGHNFEIQKFKKFCDKLILNTDSQDVTTEDLNSLNKVISDFSKSASDLSEKLDNYAKLYGESTKAIENCQTEFEKLRDNLEKKKYKTVSVAEKVGGGAGAVGGAAAGAGLGSFGGPIGTLVGGAVGGIAGFFAAKYATKYVTKVIVDSAMAEKCRKLEKQVAEYKNEGNRFRELGDKMVRLQMTDEQQRQQLAETISNLKRLILRDEEIRGFYQSVNEHNAEMNEIFRNKNQ